MQGGVTLGGKGPAHVVAAEAQLNQSTGEATFRGHARLWQETNFVSGPVIVLNQHLQTLVARSSDPAEPVRVVMLSAARGRATRQAAKAARRTGIGAGGQILRAASAYCGRCRVGDSRARRRAEVLRRGAQGGDARRRAGRGGCGDGHGDIFVRCGGTAVDAGGKPRRKRRRAERRAQGMQAQVDQMKATGHVVLTSQGRRGTGEQLVYHGRDRGICADWHCSRATEDERSGAWNGDGRSFDFR